MPSARTWLIAIGCLALLGIVFSTVYLRSSSISDAAKKDATSFAKTLLKDLISSKRIESVESRLAPELKSRGGAESMGKLLSAMIDALGEPKSIGKVIATRVEATNDRSNMICDLDAIVRCERGDAVFYLKLVRPDKAWLLASLEAKKR